MTTGQDAGEKRDTAMEDREALDLAAKCIREEHILPRRSAEVFVVLQFNTAQSTVVGACKANHVCRQPTHWINPLRVGLHTDAEDFTCRTALLRRCTDLDFYKTSIFALLDKSYYFGCPHLYDWSKFDGCV